MLQDRYEFDPQFWSLIEKHAIEIEPELVEIDRILADEQLFQMIKEDLSKRYPKTTKTGRPSTPVEVILRMLVVKRLYALSYEEVERHVRDSLVLRWFCKIYFHPVLDHSNLIRWAHQVQPATLHAFNERVTAIATSLKLTRGRKLRTDGTVVETHIHRPTDSSLLSDGVRVLSRTLRRAQQLIWDKVEVAKDSFRDRSRSAKRYARKISDAARAKSEAAKESMERLYGKLIEITIDSMEQSRTVVDALKRQTSEQSQRISQTLSTFIPRVEQVIEQTIRRVFLDETVPAKEKIVSLFEPHTEIIRRDKVSHPTEFGHKIWIDEVDGGIVSDYRILPGNPPDVLQLKDSLDHHIDQFSRAPTQLSADRGVYSDSNETYAAQRGVKRIILPKPGHRSEERKAHESKPWFRRGRRFHCGIEGRISVLKRKHDLDLCLDHGEEGFCRWVGWAIIAGNLSVMGSALAKG